MNLPADLPVLGQLNVLNLINQEREEVLLSARQRERSLVKQAPQVVEQVAILVSARPTVDQPVAPLGNAVILTSDGWLATATGVLPVDAEGETAALPLVILPDGSIAEIQERLDDGFTGVTFLRVVANGLPVVTFDDSTTIPVGQLISVLEKDLGSYVVFEQRAAGELNRSAELRHTNQLAQYTVLDDGTQQNRLGSPGFTSGGELLGIVTGGSQLVQASLIDGALQSVISQGVIRRTDRDLGYVNVARLTDEEKAIRSLPEQGILLTSVPPIESAEAASDAAPIALLEVGDVITAINSVPVTEATDLGVSFHSRPAGSSLFLTVQRLAPAAAEPTEAQPSRQDLTVEYPL